MPRPTPPYPPFFDDRHRPEDFLVAEDGGRLLGYIRLARPTPLASNAHVLQIQGFAVAGEARGRGVGRALVRAAVDRARERGARRLTLRVLGHNAPARALYESEGFAVEGVLPGSSSSTAATWTTCSWADPCERRVHGPDPVNTAVTKSW